MDLSGIVRRKGRQTVAELDEAARVDEVVPIDDAVLVPDRAALTGRARGRTTWRSGAARP